MSTIQDKELGDIVVRRSARSTQIRIRVAPDGMLRASAPLHTPLFMIKRAIIQSRRELVAMLETQRPTLAYKDGDAIGKSHSLAIRHGEIMKVSREGLRIIVTLPEGMTLENTAVQEMLRKEVIAALRREAKGYLTKRLAFLAEKHGFIYSSIRFSHSSGRWGSCSSEGTISLNIALMKLPFSLIDYVIIHELSHTVHMNHSDLFWQTVERYDPQYRNHKAALKQENPGI
jgi:hypothetical protein